MPNTDFLSNYCEKENANNYDISTNETIVHFIFETIVTHNNHDIFNDQRINIEEFLYGDGDFPLPDFTI